MSMCRVFGLCFGGWLLPRWVRPAGDGGRVVVMAESSLTPVQALIRWDPAWHADQELAARAELGFPPAMRMAAFVAELDLPASGEVLGPVPLAESGDTTRERVLIRVTRADGKALASTLASATAVRVARKEPDPVRVQLDPLELV
jgi:primosomal protein N' (replication factor Y)